MRAADGPALEVSPVGGGADVESVPALLIDGVGQPAASACAGADGAIVFVFDDGRRVMVGFEERIFIRYIDAEGNVWVGRDRDRLLAAHAADLVLVTVEQRVPGCFFDDEALAAGTIPAALVTALAVVPGGCWPMAIDGSCDLDAVRRYQQAARSDEGFADYLRREVLAAAVPA